MEKVTDRCDESSGGIKRTSKWQSTVPGLENSVIRWGKMVLRPGRRKTKKVQKSADLKEWKKGG